MGIRWLWWGSVISKPTPRPKVRKRRDPVTPELYAAVHARDKGCVAPRVCGCIASQGCDGRLQLDHVKEQPMMGKRAPSDMEHLAVVCTRHHMDGWATAHRPELRSYLREVNR